MRIGSELSAEFVFHTFTTPQEVPRSDALTTTQKSLERSAEGWCSWQRQGGKCSFCCGDVFVYSTSTPVCCKYGSAFKSRDICFSFFSSGLFLFGSQQNRQKKMIYRLSFHACLLNMSGTLTFATLPVAYPFLNKSTPMFLLIESIHLLWHFCSSRKCTASYCYLLVFIWVPRLHIYKIQDVYQNPQKGSSYIQS